MATKVSQGCFNMFTRVTPGVETETGTKLRPGIALPHAALPTTGKEIRVERPTINELIKY